MTPVSAFLIFASLATFVAGQLLLKRGMEGSAAGIRHPRFLIAFGGGITSMTVSFFLTLGLLRHFELSYLYPFQGLSVILITLLAAFSLREKLTLQLIVGALLISGGIALVAMS